MPQNARIIDIKRSFIPTDANAFPENLHLQTKEDSPETRVPVVPYIGHNFLPTAYGYRSFFGTSSQLEVDSLAPNKPDHIFVYQTLAYKNVLIALCDTGIWAKAATSSGAWTQIAVMVAPAEDSYYEWFWFIISNKLYIYRGNGANFHRIETDIAEALGIAIDALTPTFITPTAQLGMFKLGGSRIGFWDANNAIAWSSPDDVTDFTPAVLTGANVTTFNSVKGKISAIRAHGKNAIIYASSSIVQLLVEPSETFLVKATKLLDCGVPYARQSVEANPDTTHYAYTTTGIYKIQNSQPENIATEVYDFFKSYTAQPVYLQLLERRFLFFIVLDPDLINGIPQFSKGSYDSGTITFPGYDSYDAIYNGDPQTIDFCEVAALTNNGSFEETAAQATADLSDKKPGTTAEPIWTCYLSNHGIKDISNLTFDQTPCGTFSHTGEPWDLSPDITGLSGYTTDGTNKTATTGEEAWIDGKWTMERFVQVQTAIWEAEEKVLQEVINQTLSRAFFEATTEEPVLCTISNPDYTYCNHPDPYVSQFSEPKFGFNTCSFWLTRFVTETKEIRSRWKTQVECTNIATPIGPNHYRVYNGGLLPTHYGSPAEAMASVTLPPGYVWEPLPGPIWGTAADVGNTEGGGDWMYTDFNPGVGPGNNQIVAYYVASPGKVFVSPTTPGFNGSPAIQSEAYPTGVFKKTTTSSAANELVETNTGILGAETAWCEITGWRYTKNDGTQAVAPSSICNNFGNYYPGNPDPGTATSRTSDPDVDQTFPVGETGQVCNIEFTPPLAPPGVDWPDQSLTYAGATFLLQDGSIAPKYPTMYGAYAFDLHLNKWGKYKDEFKGLLDYSPINNESNSPVTSSNFGMLAGAFKEDGHLYLFDDRPSDSLLTWGKIGFYRLGFTDIQEVTFNFRTPATGKIVVDVSVDGRSVMEPSHYEQEHTDVYQTTVYPPYAGRWFNVGITGYFDVTDIRTVGYGKGDR